MESTIARDLDMNSPLRVMSCHELRVMACHETPVGRESPCVGWLFNQLGVGNNVLLRLRALRTGEFSDLELRGEQHGTFEATLPERDCEE